MKLTCSEASKLLKKLNSEYDMLIVKENQSSTFLAATGEDIESVRPDYDYEAVQAQLAELRGKMIKLKHAINVFNTTHKVPGFDLTVDEMLYYMPRLSERESSLSNMMSRLAKVRERSYGTGTNATIDYRYTNYDIEKAAADHEAVYKELSRAQTSLDLLNNTESFEIDL